MTTLIYDDTFQGFLTAVFHVYEYKVVDAEIVPQSRGQVSLFGNTITLETSEEKAARVFEGMKKRKLPARDVYKTFLSELPGSENMLLQYLQYAFANGDVTKNYGHPAVLYVAETTRKVHREKHRMEAFVRFRQTADDLYYASVEPDFNVLPLIADHFEKRYADQQWLIYDMRRNYGIYYDLDTVATVEVDFKHLLSQRGGTDTMLNDREKEYEALWQNYFRSVNIASRKNPRLHRQHMPLRYWKYLTEKH